MLRFLLDENVPVDIGLALAARGHDVQLVPADYRSSDDPVILALAAQEARVLLTLDTDFGTLIFERGSAAPPSVVLIRLRAKQLAEGLPALVAAIESNVGRGNSFVVITAESVRVRPLPGAQLH